jgi:hypothetical protein
VRLLALLVLFAVVASLKVAFFSSNTRPEGGRPGWMVEHDSRQDSPVAGSAKEDGTSAPTLTAAQSARQPGATADRETVRALHRLDEVIRAADPREQQTMAALKRFAASGAMEDLRQIDREALVALANHLACELTPSEAGTLLHQFLGLSSGVLASSEEVSSTLVGIYDALAGNASEEVRPSVLTVTDEAGPDGRIAGQMHALPAGTKRVYAVFENDFALEGLGQVLAVWRNPEDDRMVFTEFEPVRQGSAYNYVWLDVAEGWPRGRYRVELFHPEAQSLLLASESFSVR